jgi:hypothetical protein
MLVWCLCFNMVHSNYGINVCSWSLILPYCCVLRSGGSCSSHMLGDVSLFSEFGKCPPQSASPDATSPTHTLCICTSCASRGSPSASWSVCWSLGLAGGEYYSAASSGSKVGLVLSPILTQAPGRCLCSNYLIGLFLSSPRMYLLRNFLNFC